ncbi:glycosyltransferase family 2 protein [Amycolatopsis nigrescens]|uniref:glycosyltransferase family 2 protein n=1 Tax=Amycolatopsis nigrescens TaxID=381445 RepID=UPI000365D94C|nr:glycosyltransferase family 2 protein [Amycolatopsis nigrescens]
MQNLTVATMIMMALLIWWPVQNLVLAAFAWRVPQPPRGVRRTPDPVPFWIIIPALNEERVIANTVRNALTTGTRWTPVRVLVVDDGSDDATPHILAGITDPRLHVLRRNLPMARQGKGESLNTAFRYILRIAQQEGTVDRAVVGVVDGDGRCSEGMLDEIAALMAEDSVGAVQCRVRIHNRRKVLALLQDLEFGAIADSSQSLRDLVGSVGMGGNGQFTRLSVLAKFYPSPWSACLVEDLELGLRLHLSGIRVRYTKSAWVTQQGLTDVGRLLRQRTRWAQGNLQCARYLKHLNSSRFVGSAGLADFLLYLVSPWLTVPMSILFVGLLATSGVAMATGNSLGGLVATGDTVGTSAALLAGLLFLPGLVWSLVHRIRLGDEGLFRCLLAGLLYPWFLALGIVATWRALFRLLGGRNSWAKTERLAEDGRTGGQPLPLVAAQAPVPSMPLPVPAVISPAPVPPPPRSPATAPQGIPAAHLVDAQVTRPIQHPQDPRRPMERV